MNNKPKEIIDDIKDFIKDKKQIVCYGKGTMEILLDCITSLEKENEKLKNLKYKFFDDCGDEESFTLNDYLELGNKLYELQEENGNLRKQNKEYKRLGFKYLCEKNTELEERIDKALQCIDENAYFCYKDDEEVIDRVPTQKLKDILKGSDEQ